MANPFSGFPPQNPYANRYNPSPTKQPPPAPNMAFNPAQLQLAPNSTTSKMIHTPSQYAEHHHQQQQQQQQQQYGGYDARMMPPPPVPRGFPPSGRAFGSQGFDAAALQHAQQQAQIHHQLAHHTQAQQLAAQQRERDLQIPTPAQIAAQHDMAAARLAAQYMQDQHSQRQIQQQHQQQQHHQQQQQQQQQQQHQMQQMQQMQQHQQSQQMQHQMQQQQQQQQHLAQQQQQHQQQAPHQQQHQQFPTHPTGLSLTPASNTSLNIGMNIGASMGGIAPSQQQHAQQVQGIPPSPTSSARKRKLPSSIPPSSASTPGSQQQSMNTTSINASHTHPSAQNINPNVQRMSSATRASSSPAPAASSASHHHPTPPTQHPREHPQPHAHAHTPDHAPQRQDTTVASLNPTTTRVTNLPLAGSGLTIPPLSATQIADMKNWMDVDKVYEADVGRMRERMAREMRESVGRPGWWEEPVPPEKGKGGAKERFAVLWPEQKRQLRVRKLRRAGVRWEGRVPHLSGNGKGADRVEELVPIRLEMDVEHQRLRETFVWDLSDTFITPELVAQSIVDDFKLAPHHANAIAKTIAEQLVKDEDEEIESPMKEKNPAFTFKQPDKEAGRQRGTLDAAGEAWWTAWRKRIRTDDGYVRIGGEEGEGDADDEGDARARARARARGKRVRRRRARRTGVIVPEVMGEVPMEVDSLPMPSDAFEKDEECRILIKLDILVGTMKLDDQFEWDAACPTNSPEAFAALYTSELGLSGEFTSAIAHQIREQVAALAQDKDTSALPALTRGGVARSIDVAASHMPLLNYMSDGEIERTERERDKELKRKRRHARGGAGAGGGRAGARIDRTHRTPGIGFPDADPAALLAAQAATVPTTSRRAAAAAASLTIANMVASENGGSPMQLSAPEPVKQPVAPPKDVAKKARGPQRLFKPPAYPPAALRPRSKVMAPTPSTGLDPALYRPIIRHDNAEQKPEEAPAPPAAPPPPAKLTAKQLRDLEKEAKEKEYAEGQHENFIDGVWHCSNCGCPESIAVGRRKGPLGDKSQCGPCGKFYHRHRRPRPVDYHADEAYHINLRMEADRARAVNRRRGGAAALRAMNQEAMSAPESSTSIMNLQPGGTEQEDVDEDESRVETKDGPDPINSTDIVEPPPEAGPAAATSPADTSSSEEPPLALGKNIPSRANGSSKPKSAPKTPTMPPAVPPAVAPPSASVPASSPPVVSPTMKPQPSPQQAPAVVPPTSTIKPASTIKATNKNQVPRPEWLKIALDAMQSRYLEDKFDVVLRKTTDPTAQAEWRVKCLDCPGKLYTPGPAETLANFEVHLRNRVHRAKVNARVQGTSPPT